MRSCLWLLVSVALAADKQAAWPQFRGPGGSGVGEPSASFPTEFGPTKALRWKTDLPVGHGSPCVWGDLVVVTVADAAKKTLEVIAVDRRDGKVRWRHSRTAPELEKVHMTSSAATSTPATDGDRVYVYFGSLGLMALDFDGKPAWEYPMEVSKSPFGSGASPVIAGDFVVVTRDYPPKPVMVAVNRKDGKPAWTVDLETRAGGGGGGPRTSHATPLVWHSQIVLHRPGGVSAHRIADGQRVWWVQSPSGGTASVTGGTDAVFVPAYNAVADPGAMVELTPFATAISKYDRDGNGKLGKDEAPEGDLFIRKRPGVPDNVPGAHFTVKMFFGMFDQNRDGFIDAGEYQTLSERVTKLPLAKPGVLAVRPEGEGDLTATAIAWREERNVPEVPMALAYAGRVYTVVSGGILSAMDEKSGKLLFRGRVNAPGAYYASPVTAGGRIVVASAEGVVTVLGGGDTLEVLANNDLGEPVYGTPAPVGSALYVRSKNHLWAFAAK
ncbi:MAG: PQQ-binding-like beta-propeller repeat protein [Bryobacterales bacterium]|nr:PQQ-binding-like beta-propeller repeat protein [Bryobacterales bacterium]